MCDVRARRIVPLYKGLPSGALALKADMRELLRYVCFVPNADIRAPSDHVSSNPFRTFTSTSSRSSVATWLDQSVFTQSLVPKVTVASTLHDGVSARELYVGTKSLGHGEVRAADQQESELRLTQLLVELSVPASRNIDLEGIL